MLLNVTTKKGKGRIGLTPLQEQPEPPNIVALTAALVQRWPMTNLLDILKETELRVGFTEAFRTVGAREMLKPEILQRRLLLCLYGLGTNAGLKRMCSGGGEDGYADLHYVRRRCITERAAADGNRASVQRYFPHPRSGFVGRGNDCMRIRLETVRGVGSEFNHRIGTPATAAAA